MNTLTKDSRAANRGRTGAVAEQYYGLVHWLQSTRNGSASEGQAIGVTGCVAGTGVSAVAADLAVAAAGAVDQPVLLLDLTSGRSALAGQFDMSGDLGLSAALACESRPGECAKATPIANLSLLALNEADSPTSLNMDAGRLHRLLRSLESDFQFIVVDLPPADSALCFAVAGALSGVLLVIEAEQTRYEAAVRAKQRLMYANAAVLGVILNEHSQRLLI